LGDLGQGAVVSAPRGLFEQGDLEIFLEGKLSFGSHFRIHRVQFHGAKLGLKFLYLSPCQSGGLHEFLFLLNFLICQLDSHDFSSFFVSFLELDVEGVEFDFGLLLAGEDFFHDEDFVFELFVVGLDLLGLF
jgi:hypothetical protein